MLAKLQFMHKAHYIYRGHMLFLKQATKHAIITRNTADI